MTRRDFISTSAAVLAAPAGGRTSMGFTPDAFAISRPPRTAIEFMEKAYEMGAGGVQATLKSFEPDYLKQVRKRAEELGMYWEVLSPMPPEDTTQFEKTVQAAKEAGAECMRSACLAGRRYETFNTLEEWNKWVADAKAKIDRAARIAEKYKFPIGVENHKDWTVEDYVTILKKYSSQYFGVCIDFGNNISLLDDPMDVIESLAPFVINTHIKDMGVEEYPDGFLLSEVPLGTGILDLKKMIAIVRKARPNVKFSLDMLTRDPLKITCLTEKYWVTFTDRNGKYLARSLRMVREHKPEKPLLRVSTMDKEAQLKVEMDILNQCIAYARDGLGLRLS